MQFSSIIPPSFKPKGRLYQMSARWHFGNRQLAQSLSLAVVAVVMIPVAYLIIGALSAGQDGVDYLLRTRTILIVGNSIGLMLATTFFATMIAIPFAWLTGRCDLPYKARVAGAGFGGNGHPVLLNRRNLQ